MLSDVCRSIDSRSWKWRKAGGGGGVCEINKFTLSMLLVWYVAFERERQDILTGVAITSLGLHFTSLQFTLIDVKTDSIPHRHIIRIKYSASVVYVYILKTPRHL